ncbi:hypothetical protein CROQUDRAFT_341648 [Cronartium quercuum f. sp. fusiforme G11]|uniref:ER membrane protein complex subunit 4 n=1 Tax=Cronartium quercuum f. sp. fusiforme G11 TaxID=708437 RepID=A0A9P6NNK1_9BASI|nr:hypothetical protein CROQUDRAFT_341648 [Cronartium quercuum f. sp. fusiforme G11]
MDTLTTFHLDFHSSRSSSHLSLPNPPLFVPFTFKSSIDKRIPKHQSLRKSALPELDRLRQEKAWEIALAPAKQVPMQAFMMWMSGSGVQIFSVMMVYMLIKGAITASLAVHNVFKPFMPPTREGPTRYSLTLQKLSFLACQAMLLGLGLYKVNTMGLLPTRLSDWIMYEPRPVKLGCKTCGRRSSGSHFSTDCLHLDYFTWRALWYLVVRLMFVSLDGYSQFLLAWILSRKRRLLLLFSIIQSHALVKFIRGCLKGLAMQTFTSMIWLLVGTLSLCFCKNAYIITGLWFLVRQVVYVCNNEMFL